MTYFRPDISLKRSHRSRGVSILELLVALAIAALLLTATATAFDAALKSYNVNSDMAMVNTSFRNAMYQMCAIIRTAWNDPQYDMGDGTTQDRGIYVNGDGTECSLTPANEWNSVVYRYHSGTKQLQINVDGSADWHVLVENVDPVADGEPIFAKLPPLESGLPAGTAGLVEIRFKVTLNNTSQVVTASAVPRNIIY